METVLSSVLNKCRAAMLAHIPILYIKTDSVELIRQIVDSDALVMRIYKNKNNVCRPYRELGQERKEKPLNWKKSIEISQLLTWKYPHIITCAANKASMELLRDYINHYYDSACASANMLHSCAVILYASSVCIPKEFLQYTEIIDVDYPQREEIKNLIKDLAAEYQEQTDAEQLEKLCAELSGFSLQEIAHVMRKILTREIPESEAREPDETLRLHNTEKVWEIIRTHKKQKIQDGDVLKLVTVDATERIGGMKQLVDYIANIHKKKLLEEADMHSRKSGVCPPKGILVCGIPGCGKSLAAKLTARTLNLPLLQMDVGNLMARYIGESEENMRKALALAEAMSPCVLWIDELEKGFSGASGSGSSDGGTFQRMFGTVLNWMQDNAKPCFIFATANDISGLPEEFFRSGRFDELFSVYLPTAEECADIFLARANVANAATLDYRKNKDLFSQTCLTSRKFYLEIVNQEFLDNKKPRIAVGSDIQKIVNYALMELTDSMDASAEISEDKWRRALKKSIHECTVYGDGMENIYHISVGYCRLLKKSMKPTVKNEQALFRKEDYHPERYEQQKDSVKNQANDGKKQPKILEKREDGPWNRHAYDKAVYRFLYGEINKIAPEVEKSDIDRLINRRK